MINAWRRWLGYSAPLHQAVPCTHTTKESLPPADAAAVDWTGSNPRMPRGYVSEDPWGPPQEARMDSSAPRDIPPETWLTDSVLKWSSLEKLGRGERAKRLNAQVFDMSCPSM